MIDELTMDAIKLRHELHKAAELSGQECRTREILMKAIRENTSLHVHDRGRWFYAYYSSDKEGAENIAVRADMDALPMADIDGLEYRSENEGVSHRCGHDGHSAGLYSLALKLDKDGSDKNVYLIFQHAEETGDGARECAELIEEKNIGEIYAFHNWSGFEEKSIILREGTIMCASEGLRIIMKGKPSHASQPEDGINPSQALSRIVLEAERLEKSSDFSAKAMATVVGVNAGGRNFGMAPAAGEVDLTLRALREEDMQRLEKRIIDFAESVGDEAGLTVETAKQDVFPDTANDACTLEKVRAAADNLGLKVCDMEKPIRSSEDFGWFQKKCPGTLFFIGNGQDWPQVHTADYDFNDRIIETATEILYEIVK